VGVGEGGRGIEGASGKERARMQQTKQGGGQTGGRAGGGGRGVNWEKDREGQIQRRQGQRKCEERMEWVNTSKIS
jgi:hypothetical protein